MNEELRTLLVVVAIGTLIGLVVGIAGRKLRPDSCKSYAKFCMSRKWWLFFLGAVLFLGLAVMCYTDDRPYFGSLFLLFALLEAFVGFLFGFRALTPEQEAQIDASDPTKLWPFLFWRQPKPGEENSTRGDWRSGA